MPQRTYSYVRMLEGGCYVCHGDDIYWTGQNTQGVAARHHDATGHQTWVTVTMQIRYGEEPNKESGSASVAKG